MYRNEEVEFTPESVAGMILGKLKKIAEANVGTKVKDVVISVCCCL
jgi:molecular chaperone DnaK (HSP70)